MTAPAEEPLPTRPKSKRMPTTWALCDRCGAAAPDNEVHQEWHDVIEDRVGKVRDYAQGLQDLLDKQGARLAALENPISGGL